MTDVYTIRTGRESKVGSIGGELKVAKTTIPAASLRTLAATHYEVAPAPGPGRTLIFQGGFMALDYGSITFDDAAGDGNLTLYYTDGSGVAVSEEAEADALIDATTDTMLTLEPIDNGAYVPAVNAPFVLGNTADEFTGSTADSNLQVTIWYLDVPTGL